MNREVKIIAIIEDENGNEISSSINYEFDDLEVECFSIDFKYKSPVDGGPIVMPQDPPRL